jgi:hypothetical protein
MSVAVDPIIIEGPEQSMLDPNLPDGGLPPVVGACSYGVFRASRDVPEIADRRGWTYHHHVDIACWRGRLYVGWNSCEKDEDVWPARELLSTSVDGVVWTDPVEMFPQGVSTCLRMYFFFAPNGRMLCIAGLRTDACETSEDRKGGLVVREIRADHSVGEIFTLQRPPGPVEKHSPLFRESRDAGFVAACEALLDDRVYLEQQDLGRLLGPRRMTWHDPSAWPGGKLPGDNETWVCGKAFSFYRRPDDGLVGVCKMGYVTVSHDNGATWSQPVVPPTLVTGKAKVWSQRTADGRYVLVYSPSKSQRFPLAIVTGGDGVRFSGMRIVQGELPFQRYDGMHRSIGPQYTRGISHWANDGSRADLDRNAMWLVYSMNKEDIWVSRVPLPVRTDASDFDAPWNIYQPKWAAVKVEGDTVDLENRDPYDYARVMRIVPETSKVIVTFEMMSYQPAQQGVLEVELLGKSGAVLTQTRPFESSEPHKWHAIRLDAESAQRISFRTGPRRGIGGKRPVQRGTDHPTQPVRFSIRNLRIAPAQSV